MFCSVGIPKITGTSDLFDAHPAIVASYNLIIQAKQGTDHNSETETEEEETLPPLLFSQFERFLFLIRKYFSLCQVRQGRGCVLWLIWYLEKLQKNFFLDFRKS